MKVTRGADWRRARLALSYLAEIPSNPHPQSGEGHEYPNLRVGDEVNPRTFFCALLNR
jgi:hypothetical protein